MKIVFFGGRHVKEFIYPLNENFDLMLVVTTDNEIIKEAIDQKVAYTKLLEINEDFIEEIRKLEPDLGIVADFGIIIPKKLINVFPLGILNVHPSLLPKYRGATPVQSAILNGDSKTGITIIKIDDKMDHGPIIYQEEFEIQPSDFTDKLLSYLFNQAAEILPEVIDRYSADEYILKEQNHDNATYTNLLKRDDGYIDPENPPSRKELIRKINGLSPWPGVWTKYKLNNKEVIIKLHPKGIIHVEGKKPMTLKDFINGYEKGAEFLKKIGLG
jgi:methionyl-tRNA formyltransferase